jgi:hypothetical protein
MNTAKNWQKERKTSIKREKARERETDTERETQKLCGAQIALTKLCRTLTFLSLQIEPNLT